MAWAYILECSDGSFYVGSTAIDVEARVWEHNNDDERAANHTRMRRPVVLALAEQFDRVEEAFAREKQLQGWSRAKKRALIEGRGADLPALARNRSQPSSPVSVPEASPVPEPGPVPEPSPVPEPVEGPPRDGRFDKLSDR